MIGKVVAGVVCGAAVALPAMYVMEMMAAGMIFVMDDKDQIELAVKIMPFVVLPIVVAVCWIAPTVLGAWFRGCLFAAGISVLALVQVAQCYGIGWLIGEATDDRSLREAAMAGCPDSITPMIAAAVAAIAVIFSVAAIIVWRRSAQSEMADY